MKKESECKCPPTDVAPQHADTVFHLSNGTRVALCGYREEATNPPEFSEFALADCAADSIIDFWDGTQTCRVQADGNSIIVENLESLPIGPKMRYRTIPWLFEKFSFNDSKVATTQSLNRHIPKYTSSQIKALIKKYDALKKLNQYMDVWEDKLFVATLSGSELAKDRLLNFRKRWDISGAIAERFDELMAMLSFYEEK